MLDGTVNDFVLNGDKLQTRVRADHTSGPVALVSGVSLGSEMRMSYISTKIPVNQLIADKSLENADEKKVSGLTRALSSFFGN
jgi:hypothetical protein